MIIKKLNLSSMYWLYNSGSLSVNNYLVPTCQNCWLIPISTQGKRLDFYFVVVQ